MLVALVGRGIEREGGVVWGGVRGENGLGEKGGGVGE